MTQNIYDNDEFLAGYRQLRRSEEGLTGAPEWPSLQTMLPDLNGRRVLDLGCGFGWFCRWAFEQAAASVVGIDVSEKMLTQAKATSDSAIKYIRADMETLHLEPGTFDLIYSSLALHYLKNIDWLMAEVAAALVPGGHFVFSVEHPLFTAPREPAWSHAADGRKIWPLDSYLEEGPRTTNWFVPGVVKQHRTLATYLNTLTHNNLALTHAEEWGPSNAQIATWPQLADERHRPTFLLLSAKRT
jgi:SAM-dependent methyltransferase